MKYLIVLCLLPVWVSAQVFTGGDGDGFAVASVSSQTIPACEDLAGVVSGNASICVDSSTGTLTLSDYDGTILKWQKRLYPSPIWSDIDNTTSTYEEIIQIVGSWDYRAVVETEECGEQFSQYLTLIVKSRPESAGSISGTANVCQDESAIAYSVEAIHNATAYIWSYSGTGVTITGNSEEITIDFSTTSTSGELTVKGANECSDGAISAAYSITVNPLPAAAGRITGSSSVCSGETSVSYSVPTIANATEYEWTLPEGASGSSTGNEILLNFGSTASSGLLTVKGINGCSEGSESQLAVKVLEGVQPEILLKWNDILICYNIGDSLLAFQWYKDGEEIPNAIEQFYQTHQTPGEYFVTTIDAVGCISISNSIEIESVAKYLLFPNPTNSSTRVQVIDQQPGNLTISLLNSTGIVIKSFNYVKSDTAFEEQLDLSDILPGVYTVEYRIDGVFRRYSKLIIL